MSKLIIIPTPIGNLEDITLRALRMLKEVDVLLAEDTRQTKKLLTHFGIEKTMIAHHSFNEHHTLLQIIQRLKSGQNIGLVSDGGTPAISDPGFLLVRECIKEDITVECLPGATAFVPALINSGLPCSSFVFEGFLPHKKGRETALKRLAVEERTIILYESPNRVVKLMEELAKHFGETRRVSASRELSKFYEETVRGTVAEVLQHFTKQEPKGEFVVVIEGAES